MILLLVMIPFYLLKIESHIDESSKTNVKEFLKWEKPFNQKMKDLNLFRHLRLLFTLVKKKSFMYFQIYYVFHCVLQCKVYN